MKERLEYGCRSESREERRTRSGLFIQNAYISMHAYITRIGTVPMRHIIICMHLYQTSVPNIETFECLSNSQYSAVECSRTPMATDSGLIFYTEELRFASEKRKYLALTEIVRLELSTQPVLFCSTRRLGAVFHVSFARNVSKQPISLQNKTNPST